MSTGYGTYITAALLAGATVAFTLGWIDQATYEKLAGVLGSGGLAFLRAATAASDQRAATSQALIAQAVGVPPVAVATHITEPAAVPVPPKA